MRKGKSILGLRVISQPDGIDLGRVKDLVFDHETDELLALLISDKELFGLIDAQIVPWHEVRTIGPDAIMTASVDSKMNAGSDARVKEIMDRETALSGTKVYTTDGRDLGTLADMYIDEETGRVLGYELSGGFVSDTMTGKQFMQAPGDISIGRDVALVSPEIAEDLEAQKQSQPGGLQGVASNVSDQVGGAYSTAAEKVQDTYANIATASVEKQKAYVVGKTASRDVIIPPAAIAPAEAASSVTPTDQSLTRMGELPSAAGTPMASLETTPSAEGTELTTRHDPFVPGNDMVGDPLATTPYSAAERADLGMTTGSTTQDVTSSGEVPQGEVLVRKGDIITQEHADRAEQAGVLGQLVLAAGGGAISGVVSSGTTAAGDTGASMRERALRSAVGKTAGRDVYSPAGSLVIARGEVLTDDIVASASATDTENEVLAAVGAGMATQTAQTVQEGAANVWDTIKQKAAELTGAAQDRKAEYDVQAEQSRINNALGRPVTRVILDQSDNVILNTGDLITHAAIEQARAAGALDILLDSVYVADPEITPEMLRARESGQAALETQAQPSGGPITATVAPESARASQDTPSQDMAT